MKSIILIFLGLTILSSSCSHNDEDLKSQISGKYVGIFERSGNTSDVKLDFENGSYSGESSTIKFPAIGKGNYSISKDRILFQDKSIWTTEFDWTLILSDMWDYNVNGDQLILTKSNGDKYTLTKQ